MCNKQDVLAAVRTIAQRGDDEAATVAEREPRRRELSEEDPDQAVVLEAERVAHTWGRYAEIKGCCAASP
jgi:hypothetical protein